VSKDKATKCSLNFVRARMWPQTVPSMAESWVLRTKRYHLAQLDLVVWSENQTGTVPHAKPLVNMFSESLKPVGVPAFLGHAETMTKDPKDLLGEEHVLGLYPRGQSSTSPCHGELPRWDICEPSEPSEPSERKGKPMELAPKLFLQESVCTNCNGCNVSLGAPQLPYFPCHTTDLLWEFLWISPSCPSNVKLTHKNCVVNCTGSFGS
jgi:hypothetical protein